MAQPSSSSIGSNQSPLYSLLFAGGSKSANSGGENTVSKLLLKPSLLTNSEIPARFERYNSLEAKSSPRLTPRGGSNHISTTKSVSTASNNTPHHHSSESPPPLSSSPSSTSAFISRIPVYQPPTTSHRASARTAVQPESKIPVFHDSQLLRRAHSSKATPKPQITIVKRTASSRNYYNYPVKEVHSSNSSLNAGQQQPQFGFHRFSPVVARSSTKPSSIFLHSPQSLGSKIPSKSVLNIQKIDDLKDILASKGSIEGNDDESDEPKSSTPSDTDSTGSSSSSPLTPAFETANFTKPLFSSQLNHHSLIKKKDKIMDDQNGLEKQELVIETKSVQVTSVEANHTNGLEAVPNFESISKNIQNLETMAKLAEKSLSKPENLKHSLSEEEFATMEQLLDKNEQTQMNKTSLSSSSTSSLKSDVDSKVNYPEISPIPGSVDLGAIAEKILNTQKRPSLNSTESSNAEKRFPEEEKIITTAELKSIEPSPQAQKALQKTKTQKLTLTIAKPPSPTKEVNLEEIAEKIIPTPESGSLSPKPAIFLDPPLSPPLSPHLVAKPPLPPTSTSSSSSTSTTLKQRPSFNRPGNLNLAHSNAPQSTTAFADNTIVSGRPKTATTTTNASSSKLIITTESYSKTYTSSPQSGKQLSRPTSSSSSIDGDPLSPGFGTLKRFHVTGSPVSETRKFFPENASLNTASAAEHGGDHQSSSSALPSPVAVVTPVSPSHNSEVASINSNIEQIAAISFDLQSQHAYSEQGPQPSTSKFPVTVSNNKKSTTSGKTATASTTGHKAEQTETAESSSKPATKKKSKWKRFVKKLKFWKHE
ncbi:hypothetical protein TYRP_005010 [Tyrophagus putrescentiae]|nr:hypothetical protein TYRP_005010 [Tyrophagus putrescentiae]